MSLLVKDDKGHALLKNLVDILYSIYIHKSKIDYVEWWNVNYPHNTNLWAEAFVQLSSNTEYTSDNLIYCKFLQGRVFNVLKIKCIKETTCLAISLHEIWYKHIKIKSHLVPKESYEIGIYLNNEVDFDSFAEILKYIPENAVIFVSSESITGLFNVIRSLPMHKNINYSNSFRGKYNELLSQWKEYETGINLANQILHECFTLSTCKEIYFNSCSSMPAIISIINPNIKFNEYTNKSTKSYLSKCFFELSEFAGL
jgi:hypothetical protein